VALFHAGPLFHAIGLALVPETPLLLLALLALISLLNALDRSRHRETPVEPSVRAELVEARTVEDTKSTACAIHPSTGSGRTVLFLGNWLLFGLCLGLAGLSKYTAVTLAVSGVLFILMQKRLDVLRTPGPWLAVLIAGLLIAPVLYWNATHDWISFRYQLGHGFRSRGWEWSRVALSQAGQFFAYGPALFVAGLLALVAGFREWRERGVQLTLLTALPLLALFAIGSGREETLPHWTALAWLATAPLAARWLLARWSRRGVRVLVWGAAAYSVLLLLLLHGLLLWRSLPWAPNRALHAAVQGWPEAAARARALRDEMQDPTAVLFVPNWSLASRLAWYARPLAVQVTDQRFDQFDLWFGSPAAGAAGVLVAPDNMRKAARAQLARFAHCDEQPSLAVRAGEQIVTSFHFYLCRDYRPAAPGP
jgi:hypothetical protein